LRSKKLALQKLGKDFLSHSRVKIDKDDGLKRSANVSIYPKIFYLEKGQIIHIVEASPEAKGDV